MELKFIFLQVEAANITSSNRTFMELKFMLSAHILHTSGVLIAPLWN